MTTKARLHELIEDLPEDLAPGVERMLTDPALRWLLCAPETEPPLSVREIAGILEARRDIAEGRVRRFTNVDDLLADLESDSPDDE